MASTKTLVVQQLPGAVTRTSHTGEGHLGDTSYYSAELTIDGKASGVLLGHLETARVVAHPFRSYSLRINGQRHQAATL